MACGSKEKKQFAIYQLYFNSFFLFKQKKETSVLTALLSWRLECGCEIFFETLQSLSFILLLLQFIGIGF